MPRHATRVLLAIVLLLTSSPAALNLLSRAVQEAEHVAAIAPPTAPLPPEAASRDVKRFSFIAYGDTRGRRDGTALQYEHSLVIDSMLNQIKKLRDSDYPVRFVLQSGDAVVNGQDPKQWNVSFVPLINRLTTEGGLAVLSRAGKSRGNHSRGRFAELSQRSVNVDSARWIAPTFAGLLELLIWIWKHFRARIGCQHRERREAISMGEKPTGGTRPEPLFERCHLLSSGTVLFGSTWRSAR